MKATHRPKISVLVPAFNMGKTIQAAIESVLSQTEQDFEVIVANDGSTDDTDSVMMPLARDDDRITYLSHARNRGKPSIMNEMLELCSGDYVVVLDADDTLPPDSLSVRARFLDEHPHLMLVYTSSANFMDDVQVSVKIAEEAGDMREFTRRQLVGVSTYADLLTFMYRAEIFREPPGGGVRFNPAYLRGQDLGMLLEIAKRGYPVGVSPEITYNFRMNSHKTVRGRLRNRWRTMRSKLDMVAQMGLPIGRRAEYGVRVVAVSLAKMAWEVISADRDPMGRLGETVAEGPTGDGPTRVTGE